jgi:hypothetical protein
MLNNATLPTIARRAPCPASGTGDLLVCAWEWLISKPVSGGVFDRAHYFIRKKVYYGQTLVPRPRRLALMNLLPPLAEQQEIVRRVAGLLALADQLEQRLAQARKQVDQLTPSLLARAFAGKLVPQNPADEPAKKLLARIARKE